MLKKIIPFYSKDKKEFLKLNDDIIKQLNKKYIFKTLVTIIIFISIGIWCLEIYHFNKLYQDARDSIHGYWVEEITEDSRIENE